MKRAKIGWGITGAGAFMKDVLDYLVVDDYPKVDVFFSKAGEKVAKMYGANWIGSKHFPGRVAHIFYDVDESYLISGRFSLGHYKLLVVAPVTSNSVAKMAYGIADTLITNIFAQACKSRTPIIVLPSDANDVMISETPGGKEIRLFRREVDYKNILLLNRMGSVKVVYSFDELISEMERKISKGDGQVGF